MRSRGCRDPATLTRGRPHTGRPELPQDEALLALGQSQEEFIALQAPASRACVRSPDPQLPTREYMQACLMASSKNWEEK